MDIISYGKKIINYFYGNKRELQNDAVDMEPQSYISCPSLRKVAILDCYSLYACCCLGEDLRNESPKIDFKGDSDDDLQDALMQFIRRRTNLINALKHGKPCVCDGCPSAVRASAEEWNTIGDEKKITVLAISLSWPCQAGCKYCDMKGNSRLIAKNRELISKQKNFNLIRFMEIMESQGILQLETPIELSAGEITIHPKCDEILSFLERYKLQIFSNSIIYSKKVSDIISRDDGSFLNVSIDAGTAETYKSVKGIDAFDKVSDTLNKYSEDGGNIHAKYIILDENCNYKDIDGFIELCSMIHAAKINISCDIRTDHSKLDEKIVAAAIYMAKMSRSAGIPYTVLPYFGDENMAHIQKELSDAEPAD